MDDEQNEQGNEIDLGEQNEGDEMANPQNPPPEPRYPSVMLHGGPGLQRIADHGVHKIHAKVISRHMPSRHSRHHKIELELHKIKPQMKRGRPHKSKHEQDSAHIRAAMEGVE